MQIIQSVLKRFSTQQRGVAMIEFALIAPILILMLLGLLEFGTYFLKTYSVQRNLNMAAQAVASDPLSPNNFAIANTGGGFVDFSLPQNYVCASSYPDLASAQAGSCTNGQWQVNDAVATNPDEFFVYLGAFAEITSASGLFEEVVPDSLDSQVLRMDLPIRCAQNFERVSDGAGGWTCRRASLNQSCGVGQTITSFDGNGFAICSNAVANISCSSGQAIIGFSNGQPQCGNATPNATRPSDQIMTGMVNGVAQCEDAPSGACFGNGVYPIGNYCCDNGSPQPVCSHFGESAEPCDCYH